MTATRTLSKSDFKLASTCETKLYFREHGYPDRRDDNPYLALLASGGYMVESLVKAGYPDGIRVPQSIDGSAGFERARLALQAGDVTLFEVPLLVGRTEGRCDIVERKGRTVRLIEVKSSTIDGARHRSLLADGKPGLFRMSRKPYGVAGGWREYIEDVAFLTLLLEAVLPDCQVTPWLALVDSSKRSALNDVPGLFEMRTGGGAPRFTGTPAQLAALDLTIELDVTEEVSLVRASVAERVDRFCSLLDAPIGDFRRTTVRGGHCARCDFKRDDFEPNGFRDCWGDLAAVKPHVLELFAVGTLKDGKRPLVDSLYREGKATLFDIPLQRLRRADGTLSTNGARQERQIEWTRRNAVFTAPTLKTALDGLVTPLHFIDFETSRLALPYHKGMAPYGLVAFQWSDHFFRPDGSLGHAEWLNDSDVWPNHAFVTSLRAAIGDSGAVLTWSSFERSVLGEIARSLTAFGHGDPQIGAWIKNLTQHRLVDMHEWARNLYYHPRMQGRTSIKVVLDALWRDDETLREQFARWSGLPAVAADADPYKSLPKLEIAGALQDVHEGTGAMNAYQEMMYGAERHRPEARARWARLLKQYCGLDTLSMVLVFEHWKRLTLNT